MVERVGGNEDTEAWAVETDAPMVDERTGEVWPQPLAAVDVAWDRDYQTVEAGCDREQDATHIALNDPAFVLAWVAGIRAVVALHAEVKIPGYEDEAGCCNTCDGVPDWPCSTVSAIAAIWPTSPADPDREDR